MEVYSTEQEQRSYTTTEERRVDPFVEKSALIEAESQPKKKRKRKRKRKKQPSPPRIEQKQQEVQTDSGTTATLPTEQERTSADHIPDHHQSQDESFFMIGSGSVHELSKTLTSTGQGKASDHVVFTSERPPSMQFPSDGDRRISVWTTEQASQRTQVRSTKEQLTSAVYAQGQRLPVAPNERGSNPVQSAKARRYRIVKQTVRENARLRDQEVWVGQRADQFGGKAAFLRIPPSDNALFSPLIDENTASLQQNPNFATNQAIFYHSRHSTQYGIQTAANQQAFSDNYFFYNTLTPSDIRLSYGNHASADSPFLYGNRSPRNSSAWKRIAVEKQRREAAERALDVERAVHSAYSVPNSLESPHISTEQAAFSDQNSLVWSARAISEGRSAENQRLLRQRWKRQLQQQQRIRAQTEQTLTATTSIALSSAERSLHAEMQRRERFQQETHQDSTLVRSAGSQGLHGAASTWEKSKLRSTAQDTSFWYPIDTYPVNPNDRRIPPRIKGQSAEQTAGSKYLPLTNGSGQSVETLFQAGTAARQTVFSQEQLHREQRTGSNGQSSAYLNGASSSAQQSGAGGGQSFSQQSTSPQSTSPRSAPSKPTQTRRRSWRKAVGTAAAATYGAAMAEQRNLQQPQQDEATRQAEQVRRNTFHLSHKGLQAGRSGWKLTRRAAQTAQKAGTTAAVKAVTETAKKAFQMVTAAVSSMIGTVAAPLGIIAVAILIVTTLITGVIVPLESPFGIFLSSEQDQEMTFDSALNQLSSEYYGKLYTLEMMQPDDEVEITCSIGNSDEAWQQILSVYAVYCVNRGQEAFLMDEAHYDTLRSVFWQMIHITHWETSRTETVGETVEIHRTLHISITLSSVDAAAAHYGLDASELDMVRELLAQSDAWESLCTAYPNLNVSTGGIGSVNVTEYATVAETIYRGVIEAGYTPEAACGILGNIQQECSMNPQCVTGNAYGICQWLGDRLAHLKQRPNYQLASVQTSFMLSELSSQTYIWTSYGGSLNHTYHGVSIRSLSDFKTCTDVRAAAGAFCVCFERPGELPGNRFYELRLNYADQWYAYAQSHWMETESFP